LLHRLQIPYKYEQALNLKKLGIVYPDFTLLHLKTRREIYLEHTEKAAFLAGGFLGATLQIFLAIPKF
jgi:hypothetical protein